MSRRVFAQVRRGPMDNTAICVYPWELPILELIHGQGVEEVTLEQMAAIKEGVVKVERQKLKKLKNLRARYAPDLMGQLELMVYVDPEEDPAKDPAAEYNRLVDKYGADKEFPVPVIERIFGQFGSGAFTAKVQEFADDTAPMPQVLKQMIADAAAEAEAEEEEQLPAPRRRSVRKAA